MDQVKKCECIALYYQQHHHHQLIAQQVHDYFAYKYRLNTDTEVVNDIENYCSQFTDTIPHTVCHTWTWACLTRDLNYQGFMTFLKYLAAKTIILSAARISTQFKGLDYHYYEYYLSGTSRCDPVNYMTSFDVITGHVDRIKMIQDGTPIPFRLGWRSGTHVPTQYYEKVIHMVYPLLSWQKGSYECEHFRCLVKTDSEPDSYYHCSNGKYVYRAVLECKNTQQRQQELHNNVMQSLAYAPPNHLLKCGGIQFQKYH